MATEKEYDDIIAPMLAAVALRCQELGMSIVARVEWEPGEGGTTAIGNGPEASVAQRLAYIAAQANGNIDTVCIEAMKRFDCSQSLVLHRFRQDG